MKLKRENERLKIEINFNNVPKKRINNNMSSSEY